MAIISCPNCGKSISDKTKTCVHCGAAVTICSECGEAHIGEISLCPSCGFEFEKKEEKKTLPSVEENKETREIDVEEFSKDVDSSKSKPWGIGAFFYIFRIILIVASIVIAILIACDIWQSGNAYKAMRVLIVASMILGCLSALFFMPSRLIYIVRRSSCAKKWGKENYSAYLKENAERYQKCISKEKDATVLSVSDTVFREQYEAVLDSAIYAELKGVSAKQVVLVVMACFSTQLINILFGIWLLTVYTNGSLGVFDLLINVFPDILETFSSVAIHLIHYVLFVVDIAIPTLVLMKVEQARRNNYTNFLIAENMKERNDREQERIKE